MSKKLKDNDITSDDLLSDFRGKGLFPILIFTVLVHGVVLLGSSVPWMMENLFPTSWEFSTSKADFYHHHF